MAKRLLSSYKPDAVDTYINSILSEFDSKFCANESERLVLKDEVLQLKNKIKTMEVEVNEYREKKDLIGSTLLSVTEELENSKRIAKIDAERVLSDAETEAKRRLDDANSRAEAILKDATTMYDAKLQEANTKVEEILSTGQKQSREQLELANKEYQERVSELEEQLSTLKEEYDRIKDQKDILIEELKEEAEKERAGAEAEHLARMKQLDEAYDKKLLEHTESCKQLNEKYNDNLEKFNAFRRTIKDVINSVETELELNI